MRFTTAAVLAFASSVLAQTPGFAAISAPGDEEVVPAGSNYEIKWDASSVSTYPGAVTISLLGGASPSTLQVLSVLQQGVDQSLGEYTWAVDSSLGDDATYGIEISLDSNSATFQYSFPFKISKAATSSSSLAVASSTLAVASSSSSSTALTATITLSSAIQTTSALSTSFVPPVTQVFQNSSSNAVSSTTLLVASTSVPASNLTWTTVSAPSKTSGASASSTGKASPSSSIVAASGAGNVAAGSFVALGGLAMAFLAL